MPLIERRLNRGLCLYSGNDLLQTDSMSEMGSHLQEKVKSSTRRILFFLAKLVSGAIVGLTLALIFQELIGFGVISLVLIIVVVTLALLRIMKPWNWGRLLVFDLTHWMTCDYFGISAVTTYLHICALVRTHMRAS